MIDYFPLKVVKTADLDKDRNYIFGNFCSSIRWTVLRHLKILNFHFSHHLGIHPHGITSTSTVLNFCYAKSELYEHFPDLKVNLATLDGQFIFPVHRDLLLALGNIRFFFKKKRSCFLVLFKFQFKFLCSRCLFIV